MEFDIVKYYQMLFLGEGAGWARVSCRSFEFSHYKIFENRETVKQDG